MTYLDVSEKILLSTVGTTVGGVLGIGYTLVEGSSREFFGMGSSETFSDTTTGSVVEVLAPASGGNVSSAAVGSPLAASAGSTTIGILAEKARGIIVIFFQNDVPYSVVEERAKGIYDKFEKAHKPTIDGGATLITNSSEVRELLDQIFDNKSPNEIIEGLTVMERVYQKVPTRRPKY